MAGLKLTIAIPTLNGGANFQDLFNSVKLLGLTDDEYELLVVDNHSDDDTDAILKGLELTMPTLRYIRNDRNIGRVENWNKAIEESRGTFLILMNVNDRFERFELSKYLDFLIAHPEVSMMLTDITFKDTVYPQWAESGLVNLEAYLRMTFLDRRYLEFHSVGVLQQHVFRTDLIKQHQIRFDIKLPRTTDRVFVGQVIKAGGGRFYYANQVMVRWQLNKSRYHYNVHIDQKHFNFEELWVNEYQSNLQLAGLAKIPFKEFLESQLVLASSYNYKKKLHDLRQRLVKSRLERIGMEFPTASIYYTYLATIAKLNGIALNYTAVRLSGLWIVIREFLTYRKILQKKPRSLKAIIKATELEKPST